MTCLCCQEKVETIDYKSASVLRRFVTGHFKIIPRKRTRLCPRHQRAVTRAIKNARYLALLPYTRNQTRR